MPKNQLLEIYNIPAAGATKVFPVSDLIEVYEINATGGAVTLAASIIFSYSGTPKVADEFKFQYGGGVTQNLSGGIFVNFLGNILTDIQALSPMVIRAYWNGTAWKIQKIVTSDIGYIQNGNSFGVAATLGTNDAFALNLETAGATRVHIDATNGNTTIGDSTDAANKLVVKTTTSGDGIFVDGTTKPSVGGKASGVVRWLLGITTTIGDFINGSAVGDTSFVSTSKNFRLNVLGGIAAVTSFFANGVNGRVGVGGEITRATLHLNGSLAIPTFTTPEVIAATQTIDLTTREHQPFLAYSVGAGFTLSLTPLAVSTDISSGNSGRVFWIVNTGAATGYIDFGGSALVKNKLGANFGTGSAGLTGGQGAMFVIMGTYMQQVI